ncbi:MAG: carbohydrate ABC transporter permease [Oscillospiraceae bacterium]
MPISIAIALVLAYVLNSDRVYGKKILRLCFFIPYISSAVALAAVFKAMFRENGAINMILTEIFRMSHGLSWFSDFSLNKIPIIIFVIWSHIGFELIVYMAALQNVPKSLYEAADLDGASSFKKILEYYLSNDFADNLLSRNCAVYNMFQDFHSNKRHELRRHCVFQYLHCCGSI